MHLHKNHMYLLEQPSESFKIWSTIIRIDSLGCSRFTCNSYLPGYMHCGL